MSTDVCVIDNVAETNIIKLSYHTVMPQNFMEILQGIITEKIAQYGNFMIHLDLQGLNATTLSRSMPWIESIMGNFNANSYEPYLVHVFIYNAPFIAKPVYMIICRFVRNVKEKITFVPKEKKAKEDSFVSRFSLSSSSR
jgi:hypothetical protein